ncbi:hypothetical protein BDR07DRAFT_1435597 [Suillus spraguei]|nr:hypothetical protein BDR07DRAFT_1435597 [Suillus spraguei]
MPGLGFALMSVVIFTSVHSLILAVRKYPRANLISAYPQNTRTLRADTSGVRPPLPEGLPVLLPSWHWPLHPNAWLHASSHPLCQVAME